MPEVNVEIPSGFSKKIAKFELEKELERKKKHMRTIRSSIETLSLTESDLAKFGEARKKAWQRRKEELL